MLSTRRPTVTCRQFLPPRLLPAIFTGEDVNVDVSRLGEGILHRVADAADIVADVGLPASPFKQPTYENGDVFIASSGHSAAGRRGFGAAGGRWRCPAAVPTAPPGAHGGFDSASAQDGGSPKTLDRGKYRSRSETDRRSGLVDDDRIRRIRRTRRKRRSFRHDDGVDQRLQLPAIRSQLHRDEARSRRQSHQETRRT